MTARNVAIAGAGIAGLTAALCFARHGVSSDVYEQAPALGEVGAGLQISPNAAAILDWLGLIDRLKPHWVEPESVVLASGATLKPLIALPIRDFAARRWRGPYGVMHRAALQQVLLEAAEAEPLIHLHLGRRLEGESFEMLEGLSGRRPDLLVGADGVWSRIRNRIEDSPQIRFSGNVAWRFIIPAGDAPAFLNRNAVTAYLAPRTHMVTYPLANNGGFNLVAIAAGMGGSETWQEAGRSALAELAHQFSDWNPAIRDLLARQQSAAFWPLFEAGDGRWCDGNSTVLLGDAAHAMMPFAAQGAAMAIEDAFELAACVADEESVDEAVQRYERIRVPRIRVLRQRSSFNKMVYHARGPVRVARDLFLGFQKPVSLATSLDPIYAYRSGQLP